jgi:3',5'-cyclic-AMP phosphodiesterase
MKVVLFSVILFIQSGVLYAQKSFSFVFLPDVHLQHDSVIIANFERVAGKINKLHPDFVIAGGDMIYTAKNVDDKKAAALFDLMDKEFRLFRMPVYMVMGNHENVGITGETGMDKTNPMWGKQMYEKRYRKRYYSFLHQGWKFIILDGIKILEKKKDYTDGVDSIQIEWLKKELDQTDKRIPLAVSIHTPFINPDAMTDPRSQALSEDSRAILNLFKDHNLKMVLQGHNHIYMNLYINGIYYISGGSTLNGTDFYDYGFPLFKVHNGEVSFKFVPTRD